jgi:ribosomal protein L14E/L6E/L27E
MQDEYVVGQVVFSKCGRDQGRAFIIVSVEENYVYIADGKLRKIEKPKLKKKKHIQKTNTIIKWIQDKILDNNVTNHDIKKALEEYLGQSS